MTTRHGMLACCEQPECKRRPGSFCCCLICCCSCCCTHHCTSGVCTAAHLTAQVLCAQLHTALHKCCVHTQLQSCHICLLGWPLLFESLLRSVRSVSAETAAAQVMCSCPTSLRSLQDTSERVTAFPVGFGYAGCINLKSIPL